MRYQQIDCTLTVRLLHAPFKPSLRPSGDAAGSRRVLHPDRVSGRDRLLQTDLSRWTAGGRMTAIGQKRPATTVCFVTGDPNGPKADDRRRCYGAAGALRRRMQPRYGARAPYITLDGTGTCPIISTYGAFLHRTTCTR